MGHIKQLWRDALMLPPCQLSEAKCTLINRWLQICEFLTPLCSSFQVPFFLSAPKCVFFSRRVEEMKRVHRLGGRYYNRQQAGTCKGKTWWWIVNNRLDLQNSADQLQMSKHSFLLPPSSSLTCCPSLFRMSEDGSGDGRLYRDIRARVHLFDLSAFSLLR